MNDPDSISRLKRLIESDAANLMQPRVLSVNRLKPDGNNGQVVGISDGIAQWIDASSGGATDLNSLTDVVITAAASGEVLRHNGTNWVDSALAKADVGLGNVDNTSDAAKPVSTAQQAALDAKQPLDSDLTTIAGLDSGTSTGVMATEAAGWVKRTYAQVKTSLGLVKADVGLANVDNTSDANKPVSTAQSTANTADRDRANHTGTQAATTVTVSAITNLTATEVQAALAEHQLDIDGLVSGSGIPGSTMDAKGDLIVGTADNTYARRAASPTNQSPVGDSVQTDGWRNELVAPQQALDDLRGEFEGHHHDERYKGVKTGWHQVTAGTGNKSYTGLGFRPRMVVFYIGYASGAYIFSGQGAMDESGSQWYTTNAMVSGIAATRTSNDACLRVITNSGTTACQAAYTSMDEDGFTINFSVIDTNTYFGYTAYR